MTKEQARRSGIIYHELQAIESLLKEWDSLPESVWNEPGWLCIGIQYSRYSHLKDIELKSEIRAAIERYKERLTKELESL